MPSKLAIITGIIVFVQNVYTRRPIAIECLLLRTVGDNDSNPSAN